MMMISTGVLTMIMHDDHYAMLVSAQSWMPHVNTGLFISRLN